MAIVGLVLAPVQADVIDGEIIAGDDPWIVEATSGENYEVEWFGSYSGMGEGDNVILTESYGYGYMIDLAGNAAYVWIDEL
jgi:hypothetical protein